MVLSELDPNETSRLLQFIDARRTAGDFLEDVRPITSFRGILRAM